MADEQLASDVIAVLNAAKSAATRYKSGKTTMLKADYSALAKAQGLDMARVQKKLVASIPTTPPATPSLSFVFSTPPNITTIPAGVAYTENFRTLYLSGADAALVTLELVGSAAAVDLAFNGTSLSGATPDAGSVSLAIQVKNGAGTVLYTSPSFIRGVTAAAPPDVLGPTVAPAPTVLTTGTTTQTVKFIPAMDTQTPSILADGMGVAQLQRRVAGTSTWVNVGSSIALSPGLRATFDALTVGVLAGSNSSTQNNANYLFNASGGGIGYSLGQADSFHARAVAITGDGDLTVTVPPYAAAYEWNEVGLMIRSGTSATAAMESLAFFAGHDAETGSRLTAGAARNAGSIANSTSSSQRTGRINKTGNVYTKYIYSDATAQWSQVGQSENTMAGPLLGLFYVATNESGGGITPTAASLAWTAQGEQTVNVTGLAVNTSYEYSVLYTDLSPALNQTRSLISPAIPTQTDTPSGDIEWPPTGFGKHVFPHRSREPGRPELSTSGWASDPVAQFFMPQPYLSTWMTDTPRQYLWDITDDWNTKTPNGKRWFINIWPHVIAPQPYTGSVQYFLPTYFSQSQYGGLHPFNYGQTIHLGADSAMNEYRAGVIALLNRYNSSVKFGGIMIHESSWDFGQYPGGAPSGFNEDNVLAQLVKCYQQFRAAAPNKIITSRVNWGTQSKLIAHAAIMEQYQIGCGTTDCTGRRITTMDAILNGSVGGIDYRGRIPIFPAIEYEPYYGGDSAATTYAYARNVYRANFLSWNEGYQYAAAQAAVLSQGTLPSALPSCFT